MVTDESNFDAIIIGSGAGGCAAAYRLALAGKRVLLLEKGSRLPDDSSTLDSQKVLVEGRFKSKEAWHDRKGNEIVPEEFHNLGGKTKWYGAALLRFAEDEFEAEPDHALMPWPIRYADLKPYYDEAEQLLDVRVFPAEPELATMLGRLTHNGAGWQAQPLPLGLSEHITARPDLAIRFDGFALPDGYKADAEHRLLNKVLHLPNLQILTGCAVTGLLGSRSNPRHITGVQCQDGSQHHATIVLLAGGALHSPRLLQRYLENTGLAKELPASAMVGRYYKRHVLTAVLGFSLRPQNDLLRKTMLITHRDLPHSSIQPLGGWVDREILTLQMPRWMPGFVKEFFARRVYGYFLQTEDGSDPRNCVVAHKNGGAPRLDYDPARLPHAEAEHRRLVNRFVLSLLRIGVLAVSKRIPLEGSAHSCGTLVAGTDPARSVVDAHGRVHGMDNLYVVDGSVLPRSSRMNPALTIYAWSLRVAHRLAQAGGAI